MDALDAVSKEFLADLLEIIKEIDPNTALNDLVPLDIARAVISLYDSFTQQQTGRQSCH